MSSWCCTPLFRLFLNSEEGLAVKEEEEELVIRDLGVWGFGVMRNEWWMENDKKQRRDDEFEIRRGGG